jgi:hypothetical protein
MTEDEPAAIYFDIPATDALGRLNVSGKLRAVEDKVLLHWKEKERTFARSQSQLKTVELDYDDIEEARILKKFFLRRFLVLKIKDPRLIEEMPGVQLGSATLHLPRKSQKEAAKFVSLIDYKLSQVAAEKGAARLEQFDL